MRKSIKMDLCVSSLPFLLAVMFSLSIYGLSHCDPPPTHPPPELENEFSLGGRIPLEYYYVDDSNKGQGTHYKFTFDDISALIDQGRDFVSKVLSAPLPPPPHAPPHTSTWLTALTDVWLVHALNKYGVRGCEILVFGSTSPWYESLCLAMGALKVTTVEYNLLTYEHPNITTLLVSETNLTHYDVALSLSSFDHDGLGRYGDPINPDGDLIAMETVKTMLKKGGLLFLTVPIGPDVVVWNLHRRYGNIRLPLLLSGWDRVETIGWAGHLAERQAHFTTVYEPVFVLNNTLSES